MEIEWVQNQLAGYANDAAYAFRQLAQAEPDTFLIERSLNLLRTYLSSLANISFHSASAEVVARLAWAMHEHLHQRGAWHEISLLWPKFRDLASHLTNPIYYIEFTKQLAITKNSQGKVTEARQLYEEVITTDTFPKVDPELQADILHQLGVCYCELSDYQRARQTLTDCLTVIELGSALPKVEVNFGDEQTLLINARPSSTELWASKAFVFNILGNLALFSGDFARAQSHYQSSLALFIDQDEGDNLACVAYQSQGRLFLYLHRYGEAITLLQRNLTIRRQRREENGSAQAAIYLAAAYLGQQRCEIAEQLLNDAFRSCHQIQDGRGLLFCHLYFGQLEFARGNKQAAIQQWRQALNLMPALSLPLVQQHVFITYLPWLLRHGEWQVLEQMIHQLIRSVRQDGLGILSLGRILGQVGFQW